MSKDKKRPLQEPVGLVVTASLVQLTDSKGIIVDWTRDLWVADPDIVLDIIQALALGFAYGADYLRQLIASQPDAPASPGAIPPQEMLDAKDLQTPPAQNNPDNYEAFLNLLRHRHQHPEPHNPPATPHTHQHHTGPGHTGRGIPPKLAALMGQAYDKGKANKKHKKAKGKDRDKKHRPGHHTQG